MPGWPCPSGRGLTKRDGAQVKLKLAAPWSRQQNRAAGTNQRPHRYRIRYLLIKEFGALSHRRAWTGQELQTSPHSEGLRAMGVRRYTTGSSPLRITKRSPAVGGNQRIRGTLTKLRQLFHAIHHPPTSSRL